MTENETTSGGAKRRVVALAATGATVAALTVGGVAFAGAANATTPTVSLAARSAIWNTTTNTTYGSDAANQPVQITLTSPAGTNTSTGGSLSLTIGGVPSGIPCSAVTITSVGSNGAAGGGVTLTGTNATSTSGTCYFTGTYVAPAAGTSTTLDYTETVNAALPGAPAGTQNLTGTLTQTASILPTTTPVTTVATTGAAVSTTLSAGLAPKATGKTVTGSYYGGYSNQVITPGVPVGNVTVTDQSTSTPTPSAAIACQPGQLGEGEAACYALNNNSTPSTSFTGLFYNQISGYVYYYNPAPAATAYAATDIYQIGESNGYGIAVATANASRSFSDVSTSNPFAKAIYSLVNSGIIQGYADNTFQPASPVTRQAFSHYIYESLIAGGATLPADGQCDPATNQSAFTDVSDNSPFCVSINYLNSKNILNGYSNSIFNPSRYITRQAVAAIVFRYYNFAVTGSVAGGDAACTSPTGFSDVSTSNQFCGDIEWLVKNGYAKGYSNGTFHPAQSTSRQATAQLLYNVIAGINGGTYPVAALKHKG